LLPLAEITHHIEACARNNRESQKMIYRCFYSYAMSVCERYSKSDEDAEEILNEGFLTIFKKIHRYKQRYVNMHSSFKDWLKETMILTAIEYFKRNYRPAEDQRDDISGQYVPENKNAFGKLSYKKLIQAMHDLSPVYRTTFNLFVMEGMDHHFIAKKLGITVDASKLNLLKARTQLQALLSRQNDLCSEVTT
jgi:RNA polymerase sigma factor (sigma-70 family)